MRNRSILKKSLSFLLTVTMVLCSFGMTGYADEGMTLTLTGGSLSKGGQIVVPVDISGNTGIGAANIQLVYDSDNLKVKQVTADYSEIDSDSEKTAGFNSGSLVPNTATGIVMWSSAKAYTKNATLFWVVMETTDNVMNGTYELSIVQKANTSCLFSDGNAKPYPDGTVSVVPATITVTGGKDKPSVANAVITLANDTGLVYSGAVQAPTVSSITVDGTALTADDYNVSYRNAAGDTVEAPTDAGTYTVVITGKGSYTGENATKTFTIAPKALSADDFTVSSPATYNGAEQKPAITTELTAEDYTAVYSNNIDAGQATVTLEGKGNYTGTVTKNFEISKADYTSTALTGEATVPANKVAAKEFALSSINMPTIIKDAKIKSVTAEPADGLIASASVSADGTKVTYSTAAKSEGTTAKLKIVIENKNYSDITADVTVTAKSLNVDFDSNVKVKGITYGDKASSAFTIPSGAVAAAKDADNNALTGTFTVVNGDAVNAAGTANIAVQFTVTSDGDYKGEVVTKEYTVSIAKKTVGLTWSGDTNLVYDGNAKAVTVKATGLVGPDNVAVTVVDGDKVNAGTYKAKATALTGSAAENYQLPAGAAAEHSYTIAEAPQKVSIAGITTCTYGDTDIKGTAAVVSASGTAIKDGGAITWSSSDETVAKVDASTGAVTVLKAGKVNITAKAAAAAGKYAAGEATTELVINKKTVKVTSVTAEAKKYDGTTSAKLTIAAEGTIGSDSVTVTADGVYDSAAAGERTITVSNAKLNDASGNYVLDETSVPKTIKATITKIAAADVKAEAAQSDLTQTEGSVTKPSVSTTPVIGDMTVKYFIKKAAADEQSQPTWEEWTDTNAPSSAGSYDIRIEVTSPNIDGTVTTDVTLTVNKKSSGGGGGGGSSTVTTYNVNTAQSQGGEVKVNPSKAAAGATVTITTTPETGYAVSGVTVKNVTTGAEITAEKNTNGTYSFKMPNAAVTVSAAFIGSGQAGVDTDTTCSPYSDVNTSAWYHSGVHYVLHENLMNGTSAKTFAPNGKLSRAMLAQILYNQAGKPSVSSSVKFSDVKSGDWFASAVAWAAEKGVVTGFEDGTFRPNDYVTREQLAAMLYRYAGSPAVGTATLNAFNDASAVAVYAQDAMKWATANGIITGDGNASTLNPKGTASRAQAATMIMRYIEKIK